MGISANALDFSFDSLQEIQRILGLFATYCVEAATINPKYCPLAAASMESVDPASDILDRINKIASSLTQTYQIIDNGQSYQFNDFYDQTIGTCSGVDSGWGQYAQYLLNAERAVQRGQLTKRSLSNDSALAFANQPINDSLAGAFGQFGLFSALCLDQSFGGIDTPATFQQQLSDQLALNPIAAYQGLLFAICLAWPNLI